MADVLLVAETSLGAVKSTTFAGLTMARQAAAILGGQFSILVLGGPGSAQAAEQLRGFGAKQVFVCEDASLSDYVAERFTPTVAQIGKDFGLVCATASSFGKDLLPRVAARLDASYAGDCSAVHNQQGKLTFKRPTYAGNAFAQVTLSTPIQVATARQSAFEVATATEGASPVQSVALAPASGASQRVEFVSLSQVKSERPELGDAKTIVSGGRALKEKFFEVLEPLANELGAAIGASRAACDAGYAPGDYQVGQTGKIVAPQLYVAIGISGAIQHIAGMKSSKTIVAINKDPEAPIFQLADYGLVADLFSAVPALVEALKARKGTG
ncbi:MAG TPA: electron transfer flavoprotein subunit alpha/FixB family protein [Polyangiaceae bacterium]|nr:electron transfer flavoprotein subunit alpha/FixB family protein [Polyangiaceae bacterium]